MQRIVFRRSPGDVDQHRLHMSRGGALLVALISMTACHRPAPPEGARPVVRPVPPTELCAPFDGEGEVWRLDRGPFGGDRLTVVFDPDDPDHILVDAANRSGPWQTFDGGENWERASPEGAPYAETEVRLSRIEHPAQGWSMIVRASGLPLDEPSLYRVPIASPISGPYTALALRGRPLAVATDQHEGRTTHAAVLDMDPDPSTLRAGTVAVSTDGGDGWVRFNPGERIHLALAMVFDSEGDLLLPSVASAPVESLATMGRERLVAIYEELTTYQRVPEDAIAAGVVVENVLLRIDPTNGTVREEIPLPEAITSMAVHPALPGRVWLAGVNRTVLRLMGSELQAITVNAPGGGPLAEEATIVGIDVASAPDEGVETAFVTVSGPVASSRGLYRGALDGDDFRFERISDGPGPEFLDYARDAAVVSREVPDLVVAPVAETGLRISHDFGDPGSWETPTTNLTGMNAFSVEESPHDPAVLIVASQNLVQLNDDRMATASWEHSYISLGSPVANLRGGAVVDVDNSDEVYLGGGAGARRNFDGGVWRSRDAGRSWERVLGSSSADSDNPQVWALVQHPELPDWVLAGAVRYTRYDGGRGGIYSSLSRATPGSFTRLVEHDVYDLLPLAGGEVLACGAAGLTHLRAADGEVEVQTLDLGGVTLTSLTIADEELYVGTMEGRVFRAPASDYWRREAWSEVAVLGAWVTTLAADPVRPDVVYAGTFGEGIFRCEGDGTFSPFSEGLGFTFRSVYEARPSACGDVIYAATDGGLAYCVVR